MEPARCPFRASPACSARAGPVMPRPECRRYDVVFSPCSGDPGSTGSAQLHRQGGDSATSRAGLCAPEHLHLAVSAGGVVVVFRRTDRAVENAHHEHRQWPGEETAVSPPTARTGSGMKGRSASLPPGNPCRGAKNLYPLDGSQPDTPSFSAPDQVSRLQRAQITAPATIARLTTSGPAGDRRRLRPRPPVSQRRRREVAVPLRHPVEHLSS